MKMQRSLRGRRGALGTLAGLAAAIVVVGPVLAADRLATYANPVDLPYRYQPTSPIRKIQPRPNEPFREAADPTIVQFKGRYWLFASHSHGYWHSPDLLSWTFVQPKGYDVDKFAPTVVVMGGKMYLATSESPKHTWVTDDPMSGQWREAAAIPPGYQDPALFLDDGGRLYLYHGLAGKGPLHAEELDPKTLQPIAKVDIPQSRSKESRGWEVPGDYNEKLKGTSYVAPGPLLPRVFGAGHRVQDLRQRPARVRQSDGAFRLSGLQPLRFQADRLHHRGRAWRHLSG